MRILVPLDGSATAETVLPQVRRLLRRAPAELILLQVVPHFPPDFRTAFPALNGEAERYMRRMAFQFVNDGVPARGFVRMGTAAETILETAERERVSLIAMSSHGRTGLPRWVFGSVAEKVLRASPVPILLVRSFPHPLDGGVSRGHLEATPFRTILVPLDGSEGALGILPGLKAFARPLDAHVVLLHVFEDSPYEPTWGMPLRPLEQAQGTLVEACIPNRTEYRKGDVATEILKVAQEEGADLIAMATHGRSGPTRWVFGSVTEKVLRAAVTPLLVARRGWPGPEESVPAGEKSAARA